MVGDTKAAFEVAGHVRYFEIAVGGGVDDDVQHVAEILVHIGDKRHFIAEGSVLLEVIIELLVLFEMDGVSAAVNVAIMADGARRGDVAFQTDDASAWNGEGRVIVNDDILIFRAIHQIERAACLDGDVRAHAAVFDGQPPTVGDRDAVGSSKDREVAVHGDADGLAALQQRSRAVDGGILQNAADLRVANRRGGDERVFGGREFCRRHCDVIRTFVCGEFQIVRDRGVFIDRVGGGEDQCAFLHAPCALIAFCVVGGHLIRVRAIGNVVEN